LSDLRRSFCDVCPTLSAFLAAFLTAQRSQEVVRATMYNSSEVRRNAMATISHFDARLTYEDLVRMPDDGLRHEIIDGVHYVTPSPVRRHQILAKRLLVAIEVYLEIHPVGEILQAPFDVVFTRWDVVEPDLLFIAEDQRSILTEPNVQGAPALVVEVLSPGTKKRDLGIKKELFDRGGVREYWIVDPKADTVTIYRRGDGGLSRVQSPAVNEHTLTTPLLPGFSLSLKKLFRP
jgi:Uma2 family endonuclease